MLFVVNILYHNYCRKQHEMPAGHWLMSKICFFFGFFLLISSKNGTENYDELRLKLKDFDTQVFYREILFPPFRVVVACGWIRFMNITKYSQWPFDSSAPNCRLLDNHTVWSQMIFFGKIFTLLIYLDCVPV